MFGTCGRNLEVSILSSKIRSGINNLNLYLLKRPIVRRRLVVVEVILWCLVTAYLEAPSNQLNAVARLVYYATVVHYFFTDFVLLESIIFRTAVLVYHYRNRCVNIWQKIYKVGGWRRLIDATTSSRLRRWLYVAHDSEQLAIMLSYYRHYTRKGKCAQKLYTTVEICTKLYARTRSA